MTDFERVREIKEAAQGRLMAIPGVHAVGIGAKIVDGQATSDLAIMVFVVKKKPASELTPQQLIPDEIDGVKTDVYESDVFSHFAEDERKYRNPLMAGSRIFAGGAVGSVTIRRPGQPDEVTPSQGLGGIGTLGFFAKTGGPNPRVIAVTNWHVLASPPRAETTQLTVTMGGRGFTFGGSNTPGTLVVVYLGVTAGDNRVFYRTSDTDTPTTIANVVAARITGLVGAGLQATASGPQVAITSGSGTLHCQVFGPHATNTWSDIQASISGTAIALTGQASKACAAWVVLNIGGTNPTHGVFVPIAAGASATTVATAMMRAISARNLPGVTALQVDPISPGDPAFVSLSGVQAVECDVNNDIRVGQPTNSFCSACSKCCDDRIGVVIDARYDLDVALIQLDPVYVEKYRAEIQDIGVVRGVHNITTEASGYPLKKRGEATLLTTSSLLALNMDGDTSNNDPNTPSVWSLYGHRYSGAFTIRGNFATHGDSGSAVLNNNNEVVGLLFAGTSTAGIAMPIQPILAAFPSLNLTVETATTPGVDKLVPAIAAPHSSAVSAELNAGPPELLPPYIAHAHQEITSTPAGQQYLELVQLHLQEVQTLLNSNRRLAAAWQRNGGPQIVNSFMRMAQVPEEILPEEINGKPLSECLAEIQNVLARYGSPRLAADLDQYGPPLAQFAGLTYPQALDVLQHMGRA